jgi:hypothetical protein
MLLFLFPRQIYFSFIQNCDQKERHKANDPAEINGVGEIDALEEGWDLGE